jgi:hypothetical protein
MKPMKFALIAAMAASLAVAGAQAAKPEDKGKPAHAEKAKAGKSGDHQGKGNKDYGYDAKRKDGGYVSDDELRRAVIDRALLDRYGTQYKVSGYKPLPPGIRKNLARGKPIPPGIAMTRLPQGYINSLPRYEGYEWRGYGTDLVLVHALSNKIADVIVDALD